MSVLLARTRGASQPGRTVGRIPGPSLSIVTRVGTFGRSRAHHDNPADTIRARRLLGTELRYIAHPTFDDPDARDAILPPMPAPTRSARRRTGGSAR